MSAGIAAASFAIMQLAAAQAEQQPIASGSSACQLNQSTCGLLWCDIQRGDGQLPIKGAFTKCVQTKLNKHVLVKFSSYFILGFCQAARLNSCHAV